MQITKEFFEYRVLIGNEFQKDCHRAVEYALKENPKVSYQDATNVWIFGKLAEFELRLREVEKSEK
jgi:hypothetical protein